MAKESLTIDISPALREAMQIKTRDGVDYFALLGLSRDVNDEKIIDSAILERSKSLRKWQSSPAYSAEAVKLLTILHRAGKIIKDSARRGVYRQELERMERGEKVDSREEFHNLVRAAMGDQQIDAGSRKELMRYANEHSLSQADAQAIVAQVREEINSARAAEAGQKQEDEWEFRINEEGEEGFVLTLAGYENSGDMGEVSPAALMAQAARFKVLPERAAQIIVDFQKTRFKKMVKRVAGGGVINDAQARLLLPKAATYGLDQRQAYDIIADYTLSARSTEEALRVLALAQTFSEDDIHNIVENKPAVKKAGFSFSGLVPDWLRNLVLIGVAGGVLVFLVLWLKDNFQTSRQPKTVDTPPAQVAAATPAATATPGAEPTPPPSAQNPGGAAPTPGAVNVAQISLEEKLEPPSGVLPLEPQEPGDPPAFELGVTEVTCAQYHEYLKAMLEAPPAGFKEASQLPVTNVTWEKAMGYCKWLAGKKGWQPGSVTLPTHAEYLRALRGRTTRSNPLAPDFWVKARLGAAGKEPQEIKQSPFDKIFYGHGQVYDLVGNVAEWGQDAQGDKRVVLGGDTQQAEAGFDPKAQRWAAATTASPKIGFRIVHHTK